MGCHNCEKHRAEAEEARASERIVRRDLRSVGSERDDLALLLTEERDRMARIAQAIRDERSRFGLEDEAFGTLGGLLRLVEGG